MTPDAADASRAGAVRRRVSAIFEALHQPVYRYALGIIGNRSEAEEVMQEAFLSLYRELSNGRDVEDPKPWVFRVAHNLAIDCLRKKTRAELSEADAWWSFSRPAAEEDALVQDRILKQEQRACVRKALARLSPQQRRCLELRAEGLTYRQIAATLDLAVSSVQNHLSRAIQRVRDELGL